MNVDLDVACSNWPYALNSRIKCIIYRVIHKKRTDFLSIAISIFFVLMF